MVRSYVGLRYPSRMGRPDPSRLGRPIRDKLSFGLAIPTVTVGRHGWDVPTVTRIGHSTISALPGHGWDILTVTGMGHTIPVTDRTSHL